MAPVREVAFELECFEWAEERLEVAGRWKGLGPHRLNRPVLTVDTQGRRRKRIVALPGGHLGVAGETWRAAFAWPGDPTEITGAELEVGGNLVVELPLPDRRRRRRRRAAAAAEQQTDDALRAETVALHGQVERLRAELAAREREIIALRAQLDEVAEGDDDEPALAAPDDRTVEIRRLSDELERLRGEQRAGADAMTIEVQRLSAERDAAREETEIAVAAERARWQEELDELRQAFADAAAEAEETRDRHNAEIAALEERLRAEQAEVERLEIELAEQDADAERRLAAAQARADDAARAAAEAGAQDAARAEAEARERAAAPPTEPMPPPDALADETPADATAGATSDESSADATAGDVSAHALSGDSSTEATAGDPAAEAISGDESAEADSGDAARRGPAGRARGDSPSGPATQPMPPPEPASSQPGGAGRDETLDALMLDAPGPLRAGARPTTAPGEEVPHAAPGVSTAFQALKARFEGLFATNGDRGDDEPDEEEAVPRPLRTASAARARAGSAVAARRSPGEVWATRVLAAIVVAVLLTAFVLILIYIA
jgi:hypothetical protein